MISIIPLNNQTRIGRIRISFERLIFCSSLLGRLTKIIAAMADIIPNIFSIGRDSL